MNQLLKTALLLEGYEDDAEHHETLQKTGFWGKAGAGCLIIANDTKRVLVPLRSRSVEQPNTWGVWGGAIDSGKNPEQAVQQEVREEAGYEGQFKLFPVYVFKATNGSGFQYFNFFALVEAEFEPQLNWETQNYKWLTAEQLQALEPKHFGLKALLEDRNSMMTLQQLTGGM